MQPCNFTRPAKACGSMLNFIINMKEFCLHLNCIAFFSALTVLLYGLYPIFAVQHGRHGFDSPELSGANAPRSDCWRFFMPAIQPLWRVVRGSLRACRNLKAGLSTPSNPSPLSLTARVTVPFYPLGAFHE